jgi:predicted PurR-regulated permease PerM
MEPTQSPGLTRFARRVLTAVTIAAVTVLVLLLLLWFGAWVFLLVFASVLLAIFLYNISHFISDHTPLAPGWSLAVVVLGLSAALGIGVWLIGDAVGEQIDELSRRLPHSLQQLQRRLERYEWAQGLLAEMPTSGQEVVEKTDVVAKAPGVLSKALGALLSVIIFLFLGLYLAIDPGVYKRGLLRLVPLYKRDRVQGILDEIGHILGRWLVGRIFSMLMVGGITTLGLWLLRVPLGLALGLLAALGELVPNIGPLLAFIPAILLAFTGSSTQALAVFGLYLGVQGFESYVLTPLVEKRAVSLPPALTITAQVLLGLLAGGLGLILAAPLTATVMVLVQRLYVEDVLHDSTEAPLWENTQTQQSHHSRRV